MSENNRAQQNHQYRPGLTVQGSTTFGAFICKMLDSGNNVAE